MAHLPSSAFGALGETDAPSATQAAEPAAELDERQLLLRHRAGDSGAFAELVARYRAPVYGYLVRSGVETDADDLFQEIFLRLHAAAWSYRADRPLHPWVFTIVANTVRSHLRKRRVRRLMVSAAELPLARSSAPDGQDMVEARQTASRLDTALRRLAPVAREVVLLCCVERLAQSEVAEILGLPVNTVKTHLRRARLALADALTDSEQTGEPR